ncbi:hypothetical protein RN001_003708 [Aquatica leii]|uniref:Uncharacterized protein n=1 Tax=Aquatica leii TaxID=1421715 RepID=A0AAN7Q9T6_9COLE|nr:hypothetical protein RN001_003708 [Aquatica leii]
MTQGIGREIYIRNECAVCNVVVVKSINHVYIKLGREFVNVDVYVLDDGTHINSIADIIDVEKRYCGRVIDFGHAYTVSLQEVRLSGLLFQTAKNVLTAYKEQLSVQNLDSDKISHALQNIYSINNDNHKDEVNSGQVNPPTGIYEVNTNGVLVLIQDKVDVTENEIGTVMSIDNPQHDLVLIQDEVDVTENEIGTVTEDAPATSTEESTKALEHLSDNICESFNLEKDIESDGSGVDENTTFGTNDLSDFHILFRAAGILRDAMIAFDRQTDEFPTPESINKKQFEDQIPNKLHLFISWLIDAKLFLEHINMPRRSITVDELIHNLVDYFNQEKQNNGPLIPLTAVHARVSDALKIDTKTSSNALRRHQNQDENKENEPQRKSLKTKHMDERQKSEIRTTIYNMYINHEHVTLDTLLTKIKEEVLKNARKAANAKKAKLPKINSFFRPKASTSNQDFFMSIERYTTEPESSFEIDSVSDNVSEESQCEKNENIETNSTSALRKSTVLKTDQGHYDPNGVLTDEQKRFLVANEPCRPLGPFPKDNKDEEFAGPDSDDDELEGEANNFNDVENSDDILQTPDALAVVAESNVLEEAPLLRESHQSTIRHVEFSG